MKKKLIIFTTNIIVIIVLFCIDLIPTQAYATPTNSWWDEFQICSVDGIIRRDVREHFCWAVGPLVSCTEQDCTMGIYDEF